MRKETVRFLLLRHGEVTAPPGALYGQTDVPLSPRGEIQSREAARALTGAGICRIVTSDLARCRLLADALGEAAGVPIETDPRLREVDFGAWSGLTWKEIDALEPGAFAARLRAFEDYRPPGGENIRDLADRTWQTVEGLMNETWGGTVAIVAHAGVNRVILARLMGLPFARILTLAQDFCCANVVDIYPDGAATLRLLNGRPEHAGSMALGASS